VLNLHSGETVVRNLGLIRIRDDTKNSQLCCVSHNSWWTPPNVNIWVLRSATHVTTLLYLRCESEKNFIRLQKFKLGASTPQNHLLLRDATARYLMRGLSELSQWFQEVLVLTDQHFVKCKSWRQHQAKFDFLTPPTNHGRNPFRARAERRYYTQWDTWLSILVFPSHSQHLEDGDGVSPWTLGEPPRPDAAVCPRTFRWLCTFWCRITFMVSV
jgi:hypothetical protein